MGTQIVELTGDEAALLRSLDKVVQKQLELDRKLRDTGENADAFGTRMGDALAKVEAESAKALKGLIAEMKTLGPEGQAAAAALREHLQSAGKAGMRSMDAVIDQLRLIDPEAAAAAESARESLTTAGQATEEAWAEQLALLRQLGPEGRAAAREIEESMETAAAEAAGGIEGILQKLQQINPAVDSSAQKIRNDLAQAANYTEREFAEVLDELRAMGPEGRAAAAEIRKQLVDAGRIAEKSMDDVVNKLKDIDPAVATAAQSVVAKMRMAGNESGGILDSLGGRVASYVASIGLAATAVEAVRKVWVQVREEQESALSSLQATQDPDRRLLQVSDSQEQFRERRTQRDDLAMQFGVDRTQVSTVLFDAISQGFEDSVPEIIRASQVIDPNAASAAGGKLSTLFDKEDLTATQTISATLVGAKSSEADFETLAKVLPVAAEGGRQLGASFAETAAAVAVLTSDFATAATAADRFKAFSSKAALDDQFKGQDITNVVEQLSKMSEDQRKAFLGDSQEVNAFYSAALPRIAQIREQAGLINEDLDATARGGGALNAKVAIGESDPELIALRDEARAQQRKIVTEVTENGIEGATASAAQANVEAELLKNDNVVTRTVGNQLGLTSALTGSAAALGLNEQDATSVGVAGNRSAVQGFTNALFPGLGPLATFRRRGGGAAGGDASGTVAALAPGDGLAPAAPLAAAGAREPGTMENAPRQPDPTSEAMLAEQRRQTALLEQQTALQQRTAENTVPKPAPVRSITPDLANQQP